MIVINYLKHTNNVSPSLPKQEKIDMNHYDKMVKVQKEIVAKNKRKSNSDDDSGTYSKISIANVLDEKTRQPYNADPGVQASNFKKAERHKDYCTTRIAAVNHLANDFTE